MALASMEKIAKLIASLPTQQSVFLYGPPGNGKTACSKMVPDFMLQDAENPPMCVIWDLGSRLPEDILGLPYRQGDATFFAPPMELELLSRRNACGVLVLDDLTAASQAVKIAAFRLTHERAVGSLKLAPNVRVIATGNRREDKSGATPLPAALANRLLIFEYTANRDTWVKWYLGQGMTIDVPAFLKWKPEHFSKLPKEADEKGAFATPRQWEAVGRCLEAARAGGMLLEVCGGLVGEGTAHEFVSFLAVKDKLAPPEKILDNPQAAVPEVPTEVDVLIALMTGIAHYAATYRKKDAADMPGKFIEATAYLASKAREYAGVAIDSYWASGGQVAKLSDYIRNNAAKSPLIKDLLTHIQAAVHIE